jgi:hypothetical protein
MLILKDVEAYYADPVIGFLKRKSHGMGPRNKKPF